MRIERTRPYEAFFSQLFRVAACRSKSVEPAQRKVYVWRLEMNMMHLFTYLWLILMVLFTVRSEAATETATFAGGCFWCMEEPFEKLEGVISVTSGFCGGGDIAATYKDVSAGGTKHLEAVQITFDPSVIQYEELLSVFWSNIDPGDAEGQFCDRGAQYRSAIFFHGDQQRVLAEKSLIDVEARLQKKAVTPILPAGRFFAAEAYHQDFYKKNALRYKQYKIQCQRDRRLREIWGGKE